MAMRPAGHKGAIFSPKEFLKARRPERFSDSAVHERPILDRSILEYHLETLTSRNQEAPFATFARHLAQREICPNLLPQTGPTGGGDSKVDSETYPVADAIALGWFVGIGREASSERWGFAFSAKKKWQEKMLSDVAKAIETGRGYTKMFFVSNQFIRDKKRAQAEDELRVKYGVDVRILDRTWILDKVFTNGHEALAIKDLDLVTSAREEKQRGPLDTQRELDLREIEARIKVALQEGRISPQLAEDCIESANLARQLERPRTEVEGLYERAEELTTRCGTEHQRLKCAYQQAWTAFWWHEDYERFNQLYATAEQRAKGSLNAYDLELLSNLWTVLHGAVLRGKIDPHTSFFSFRTDTLSRELERLSKPEDQPSTVLHVRALRLQMDLSLSLAGKKPIEPVLREFQVIIRSCEGLAGFPLEPLVEILTEIGEFLGGQPAYDELFEAVVSVQRNRKADVVAARMLLQRGAQQLSAGRHYDAIRTIGLSLRRLYKHESRDDAVRALYLCGCAYERVGLLWAARGTLLSAASLAATEFWEYGEVTKSQAACYRALKWFELQLGRVPQALSWHEVEMVSRGALAAKGENEELDERDMAFDASLGLLFLKTDLWELKRLSRLPDVLNRLGLFNAWAALLYALGHEDKLRDTFYKEAGVGDEVRDFFLKWRDHRASRELSKKPALYEERKVNLTSHLLGCDINVEVENLMPCLELAESLLAALEALLSTGTVDLIGAQEPVLAISICKSDFVNQPFEFKVIDDTGRPHVSIVCSMFHPYRMKVTMQEQVKEKLFELLGAIFARVFVMDNPLNVFERLLNDELAFDRSVNFSGSLMAISNVLGNEPKSQISSWSDQTVNEYPLLRSKPWDANDVREPEQIHEVRPLTPGEGDVPADLIDRSSVKQKEIQTVSLIRQSLWEKAKWVATGYATGAEEGVPPILALVFEDPEAGELIFRYMREDLGGDLDVGERLRIAIVRGINEAEPYSYRVVIGSSVLNDGFQRKEVRYGIFVSRINTMRPESAVNLERFLRAYEKFRFYFLMPAVFKNGTLDLLYGQHLSKHELSVRYAWEIGRNDPDSIAVHSDDAPIIPPGQPNAPVGDLIKWKQEKEKS